VKEVVDLTLNFYKRNYIEGLFLSSGVIRTGDYTMEEMVRVAKSLRLDHDFRGYIHLKLIPEASPELAAEAGLYADRVSINVELPRTRAWRCWPRRRTRRASRRRWAGCAWHRGPQ
jgi:predicted DNA-binding helix-hairpin-helix protein